MKVYICISLVSCTLKFSLSFYYPVPLNNLLYVLYKKCFLSIAKNVMYDWCNIQVRITIWKNMGQFLVSPFQTLKWSVHFQMHPKRLFKSFYFVPRISIVFLEERGGSYFYIGWLLVFSDVLTLTCCNTCVFTFSFGSLISCVGNNAVWEPHLLNLLRDGKRVLLRSLPELLFCCYYSLIYLLYISFGTLCTTHIWPVLLLYMEVALPKQ